MPTLPCRIDGLILLITLVALVPTAAMADIGPGGVLETTQTGWIDWGPIVTAIVTALVGSMALIGRYVLRAVERYLEARTGLELDDCTRRYLETTFENALSYGAVRTAELAARGRLKTDVRSVVLAEGAQYVIDTVPDALARFQLDRAGIERRLAARLGLPQIQPADMAADAAGADLNAKRRSSEAG